MSVSSVPSEPNDPSVGEPHRLPPMSYYVKITLSIVLTLVFVAAVYKARSILVLIFLAMFIAVGLEPVIARLERRGIRRGFTVTGLGLIVAGALVALVMLVIAPAARQVTELVSNVPDLISKLDDRIQGTALGDYINQPDVQANLQKALSSALQNSAGSLGSVFGVVGGLVSALFSALTLFVLIIYFTLAMPRLRKGADRLLGTPERRAVLDEALSKVGGYVTGQLTICLCAGIFSYVAMLLIGVPYPAILAIVIAVLDAVPQVGATIGAVIAVLVALTAGLPIAIGAALYFIVYQQAENYLIAPRIFSQTIALTPLASFVSVLLGAALAGVIGAIVALADHRCRTGRAARDRTGRSDARRHSHSRVDRRLRWTKWTPSRPDAFTCGIRPGRSGRAGRSGGFLGRDRGAVRHAGGPLGVRRPR